MNKNSQLLEITATELVEEIGLLDILKKYGEPRFIGSYRYGVMTSEDVDVHVLNKDITKSMALNLLNEIADINIITSIKITDFVTWRKFLAKNPENLPQLGYFVGARFAYQNTLWRVDISLIKEEQEETYEYEKFFDKANKKTKERVIEFKKRIKTERLPYFSKDIYRAFMEESAANYQELLKYLEGNHVKS